MTTQPPTQPPADLISDHSRHWENYQYVYPVLSRRSRGLSIGINLNPDGACNFDCIYCQVDRAPLTPGQSVDLHLLKAELNDLLKTVHDGSIWQHPKFAHVAPAFRRVNDIAFSGDGEPTSFPKFFQAVDIALQARERYHLDNIKIIVITNATLFHREAVNRALSLLDESNSEIWAKLDAGSEYYYQLVNRSKTPLSRILDNILRLGRQRKITIQTLLMNIDSQPMSDREFENYLNKLNSLINAGCRIATVQLYTVARTPAESNITPLDDKTLDNFAHQLRANLPGLAVETYYGTS